MGSDKSELKLAILIDAENVSYKYIDVIINEANALGDVIHKRIYGNWAEDTKLNTWKETILDYSIQPVQQYSYTTGKNASDSCMIIEAMDLLFQGKMDGFCIVSSDSDFTRLAARLRESEMYVLGMGEQKTPRSFISACNKFSYLDLLYADAQKNVGTSSASEKTEEAPGADKNAISTIIKQIIEEKSDDEGWMYSATLGNLLNKRVPDFDVRNFGYPKLTPFINSLGIFEVKQDPEHEKIYKYRLKE